MGGKLEDTTLVMGVVVDKDMSHPQMPKVSHMTIMSSSCDLCDDHVIVHNSVFVMLRWPF